MELRFLVSVHCLMILIFIPAFMKISRRVSELLRRYEIMTDGLTDKQTNRQDDYNRASADFFCWSPKITTDNSYNNSKGEKSAEKR